MDIEQLSERLTKIEVKIDILEENSKELKELKTIIYDNALSNKELATEVKNLVNRLNSIESRVSEVVESDSKKFNKYKEITIGGLMTAVIALLFEVLK